jgi:uncharacterized membrane protein YkvA (DUF1232 family)
MPARARAGAAKAARARGARPSAPRARTPPPVTARDLKRAIIELANIIAPGDVGDFLASESELRDRVARLDGDTGARFNVQITLALQVLRDHVAGECPQIPYFTISLLGAALAYLLDDLDMIPDFLPGRGTLDDAAVLAMACTLAEPGLRRYCEAKGVDPALALGRPRERSKETR